jgi:DNA-binding response OmpR family regulator
MAKILIVDDDPDITFATELFLKKAQHEVQTASNRADGMKAIEDGNPDLIILDVMMETRTEGFHVSLKLRDRSPDAEYAAHRNVPILMLTSIHQSTSLRFNPDEDYLPVNAFLEKSVRLDILLEKIEELLAAPVRPEHV